MSRTIADVDPDVAAALENERLRQNNNLEMIASENFVSKAVMAAAGSIFTNKYAEGYPGRRYYGGCEQYDIVENLARDRAKQLFGAEHANVQPHSGAQANMAVLMAMVKPGETILGMDLSHGGHLTHGHPLNYSGKTFKVVFYGVTKEHETLDYDALAALAAEHKPRMIICGASAYPRIIDFERIGQIARDNDALCLADIAHIAGLVVAGLHPSPVPHVDFVTTTTHKTLRGPRGGLIMCRESHAKEIDRALFPGVQGGPLMHGVAAKAVAFREALELQFGEYQKQVIRNASPRVRRDRQPSRSRRRVLEGSNGQGGREGARARIHYRQQEHDSVRHAAAAGRERRPARDAGADDEGNGRGGHAGDRGLHRPGAHGAGGRGRGGVGARRRRGALREVPAVSVTLCETLCLCELCVRSPLASHTENT